MGPYDRGRYKMQVSRGRCLSIHYREYTETPADVYRAKIKKVSTADVELYDLDDACERSGDKVGPPKPAMRIHHDSNVIAVAWSTAGDRFATVTDTHLFVYDDAGTRLRWQALAPRSPTCLCWSPDDLKLAYVCDGRMCILTLGDHVDAAVRSAYFWEGWRPTSTTWNPTWPGPAAEDDGGDGDLSADDAQSGDDYEDDGGVDSGDEGYSTDSTATDFDSLDGYGTDPDNPHHSYYLTDHSTGTPHHSAGCLVVPASALYHNQLPKNGFSLDYYSTAIEWSPDGTQILASFYRKVSLTRRVVFVVASTAYPSHAHQLCVFTVTGDDSAILGAPIQVYRLFADSHYGPEMTIAAKWSPDSVSPPPPASRCRVSSPRSAPNPPL